MGTVRVAALPAARRISPPVVKGDLVCTLQRALMHLSNCHHHGSKLTGSLAQDALAQDGQFWAQPLQGSVNLGEPPIS